MALFLPFQKGKERSFHSRNGRRTERSCFYQTDSTKGWFLISFLLLFNVLYLFRSICLRKYSERATVRVSGRCADLAEYLKLFVAHHGSKECYELRIEGGRMDKWMKVASRNGSRLGEIGKAGGWGGCLLRRGWLPVLFLLPFKQGASFVWLYFFLVVWGGGVCFFPAFSDSAQVASSGYVILYKSSTNVSIATFDHLFFDHIHT